MCTVTYQNMIQFFRVFSSGLGMTELCQSACRIMNGSVWDFNGVGGNKGLIWVNAPGIWNIRSFDTSGVCKAEAGRQSCFS